MFTPSTSYSSRTSLSLDYTPDIIANEEEKSEKSKKTLSTKKSSEIIKSVYHSEERIGGNTYKPQKINLNKPEYKKLKQEEIYPNISKRKREDENSDSVSEQSKIRRITDNTHTASKQIESKREEIRDRQIYPQRNDDKLEYRPRSNSISPVKFHFLPMMGEIYLKNIESGIKKFEGRIYGPQVQKMKVGDELKLFDNRAGWGIICKISSLDIFKTFESMLLSKGVLALLPQLTEESRRISPESLLEKGTAIYRGFPQSHRVTTLGVAAIGVIFINRVF